jgi:DNA ligase (NAD+)
MAQNLLVSALKWDKPTFEAELLRLKDLYYNASLQEAKQIIPDKIYDQLVGIYESKFGPYNVVGALPREEKKETLPFYMGSLSSKARTAKELDLWLRKYPNDSLIIMLKIDGISAAETTDKVITRGDHRVGTNITRTKSYMYYPKLGGNEAVRGEIAISHKKFEKYANDYDSSRNIIFGAVNAKNSFDPEIVKDFDFLAYRFEDGILRTQAQQLQILEERKFIVPWHIQMPHPKSSEELFVTLTNLLKQQEAESEYSIDGLVIYANGLYSFPNNEDPKHAIAFKGQDISEITEITEIQWNQSKWGLLKPRIQIKPVYLDGANIEWITGHNAKFIVDNDMGPGTVVEVIRSGKVIPKIKKILQGTQAQLPQGISYHWNENKVEFVVDNMETSEIAIKKIYSFFKTIKAKHVGEKTVEKLYNGGLTSLDKFFNATIETIIAIPGFASAGATRIVEAIKGSITNADLATVASASGSLGQGFGIKKIQSVIDNFPDFLTTDLDHDAYVAKLQSIGGFNETAYDFAENIEALKDFLDRYPQITIENDPRKNQLIIQATKQVSYQPIQVNQQINPQTNYQPIQIVPQVNTQTNYQPVQITPQVNTQTNYQPIQIVPQINPQTNYQPIQIVPQVNTQTNYQPVQITSQVNTQIVPASTQESKVKGKKILFSGFVGDDLKKRITKEGGLMMTSVSKNTDILVVKDPNDKKGKIQKAEELNETGKGHIEIIQLDDFLAEYF